MVDVVVTSTLAFVTTSANRVDTLPYHSIYFLNSKYMNDALNFVPSFRKLSVH